MDSLTAKVRAHAVEQQIPITINATKFIFTLKLNWMRKSKVKFFYWNSFTRWNLWSRVPPGDCGQRHYFNSILIWRLVQNSRTLCTFACKKNVCSTTSRDAKKQKSRKRRKKKQLDVMKWINMLVKRYPNETNEKDEGTKKKKKKLYHSQSQSFVVRCVPCKSVDMCGDVEQRVPHGRLHAEPCVPIVVGGIKNFKRLMLKWNERVCASPGREISKIHVQLNEQAQWRQWNTTKKIWQKVREHERTHMRLSSSRVFFDLFFFFHYFLLRSKHGLVIFNVYLVAKYGRVCGPRTNRCIKRT